ncbi:DUF5937 family protein [Actinosynnema sp. NPDC023587]|uniref:ArsR/SmtB family transcription factor n=1 Tax=Actinosynnema sp. NPDC023587 TaxID=3154695 RepID=UPI00340F02D6
MIELVLGRTGAHRVRFAISPLEEALGAIEVILGKRSHPAHLPWLRRAADRAGRLPLAELFRVLSGAHYITDFLSPPPGTPETTAAAQLDLVRATPPAQVALELARVDADLGALPDDPERARDLLAAQLEIAWTELVEPDWPRLRHTLLADVDHRARRLANGGIALALADLHQRVRLTGDTIGVASSSRGRVHLDHRGLQLIPSVFAWPGVGVITGEPWHPALLYPARGVAELWSAPDRPPGALAGVLGRSKAALLSTLNRPAGTAELALRLGLAPSTVSGHLTALRAAGLLATTRHGHEVRYHRTGLGDALLRP